MRAKRYREWQRRNYLRNKAKKPAIPRDVLVKLAFEKVVEKNHEALERLSKN